MPFQTDLKLPVYPSSRVPASLQNEMSPNRWDCNFHDSVVHLISCLSFQFYEGYRHSSWVFVKLFIYPGTSYPCSAQNILCRFLFLLLPGTSGSLQALSQEEQHLWWLLYSFLTVFTHARFCCLLVGFRMTLCQQTGAFPVWSWVYCVFLSLSSSVHTVIWGCTSPIFKPVVCLRRPHIYSYILPLSHS